MRVRFTIIASAIILFIVSMFTMLSCSLNDDKNVYNQELFQFDNVFINSAYRSVFENQDSIYIASTNENSHITRLNTMTGNMEDLGVQGYNLTVYKDYLYFDSNDTNSDHITNLYRIDLNKISKEPELVSANVEYGLPYTIANDTIYFYWAYMSIFSININDFSQITDISVSGRPDYFIAGIDEKYRYIVTKTDADGSYISFERCLYKDTEFKNREYLFDLKNNPAADYRFNDFLVVKDGFVYYIGENRSLYKCEIKPGAESELIYAYEGEKNRFDMLAVTSGGIYVEKYHTEEYPVNTPIYDDYIYRLDLNGKNETQLSGKRDLQYFVSSADGKLYYLQNNTIYAVE